MLVSDYINRVNQLYQTGISTEHSFRGILDELLRSIDTSILVTNEPKKIECGAPDYLISRKQIPIGYIEAKDLFDTDLDGLKKAGNKEQFDRYKDSLDNIVFTDYLSFHFYRGHDKITSITIAEKQGKKIIPLQSQFDPFIRQMQDFMSYIGITIKNPKKLSQMMAGKARLLCDIINNALDEDEKAGVHTDLMEQFNSFKKILIHDITNKSFADVYAQTIVYGMFAARLHDPTLPTFSRQEAAELIPKSNPFLRKLFGYIAGPDLDDRIKWIVDDLVQIFLSCNVEEILHTYGKSTKMEDPIIHFYETFLAEYDPKLRKARGVWYTPEPVVNFIVRAVDDILKTEFGLSQGLADTSKTTITVNENGKEIKKDVHRVQILDPAAGTGTFLVETIKQIHKKFEGQQGIWNEYVDSHLIPRLNGFELLMASYAMAHLKIDLLLKETGYTPKTNQRLRVFLTNSLEEPQTETDTLFSNWLTTEANEANKIKNETPVMCVIGNPPYFGFKSNESDWIKSLIDEYKFISGININEKKHRLNNDYVKFIRFAQFFIENNETGIIAYINDHGFLFNPTFRGMRWNLMNTFDQVYILDLHGNSKKRESMVGNKDENVFDIQQGVSINFFVKTGKKDKNELATVKYSELYGAREDKYEYLSSKRIGDVEFKQLSPDIPFYFFTPNKLQNNDVYSLGFSISEVFKESVTGCVSGDDKNLIGTNCNELTNSLSLISNNLEVKNYIKPIEYRPFDRKAMYYINTHKTNPYPVIKVPASYRSRHKVMRHLVNGGNFCLIVGRQGQVVGNMPWNLIFISNDIVDLNMFYRGGVLVNPLYLNGKDNQQQTSLDDDIFSNLNIDIVNQIADCLGSTFTNEEEATKDTFAPIDLLDYIYAVLHSPAYREKYKEFLKIDFPRVPYPKDADSFWKLVKKGKAIRELHLLESPLLEQRITQYPIAGTNQVGKVRYEDGKVYINESQYFSNVPQIAWEFYIGGYQPAQKWLKDRKDRTLNFEDINHYQHIIIALTETDRLMKEIDDLGVEW